MGVRQKVLASAEQLFADKGYERTSVQDIIDHADVSKGGLYHHFDTKEAILDALLLNFARVMRVLFEKSLDTVSDEDGIQNVFMRYATTKDQLPQDKQELYLSFLFTPSEIVIREKFLHYIREEMVDPIADSIERLTEHPHPKEAAYMLLGMSEIQTRLPPRTLEDPEFGANFGSLFLEIVDQMFSN